MNKPDLSETNEPKSPFGSNKFLGALVDYQMLLLWQYLRALHDLQSEQPETYTVIVHYRDDDEWPSFRDLCYRNMIES